MKSDKIVWSQATIEELKNLLLEEEDEDFGESEEQISLDFPWEVVVVSQKTVTDEGGGTSVNAVLSFDEVAGAEDYEVRISVIEDDTSVEIGPISEWNLNTTDGYLLGLNSARFTESSAGEKTAAVYPLVVDPSWQAISLNLTVNRPVISADGFAVALADSTAYPLTYVGDIGSTVGFFNTGGEVGTSYDTTQKLYCAYNESLYVPTGNEGPTIRFNDGTTKTRINTISAATWAASAVGSHAYVVSWTRTGAFSANMRVTFDGTLIAAYNGVWVPQSARIMITAATGAAYNVHEISNVGGYIEY